MKQAASNWRSTNMVTCSPWAVKGDQRYIQKYFYKDHGKIGLLK